MKEILSSRDRIILSIIARVRGIRAETLGKHLLLLGVEKIGADAARKTLERLCDKGFLVASPMPSGSQLFRLSHKGVALTGAPAAYANSPSSGTGAEMLAVSVLACRTEEFLFPTKMELVLLLGNFEPDSEKLRFTNRFVLRTMKIAGSEASANSELHVHAFLAELRPANDLARRAAVLVDGLRRNAIFRDLLQVGLLGVTVAVPSRGVKASLERISFDFEISISVVEELQDLIAH